MLAIYELGVHIYILTHESGIKIHNGLYFQKRGADKLYILAKLVTLKNPFWLEACKWSTQCYAT